LLARRRSLGAVAEQVGGISTLALEAYALDEKVTLPPKVLQRLTKCLFGGGASYDFASGAVRMAADGEQR
jgi:hypothetical protein